MVGIAFGSTHRTEAALGIGGATVDTIASDNRPANEKTPEVRGLIVVPEVGLEPTRF